MSERDGAADDTLRFGLLMEGAQTHQRLAETQLQTLRAHTQGLDAVVRDAIRRTLVEELQALTEECDASVRALRDMRRAANLRGLLWSIATVLICTVIPAAIAHLALPSEAAVAALKTQRDSLARDVARLELQGGKVEWRVCGDAARLCVRIDVKAPIYGEHRDFYVVQGYSSR